MHLWVFIRKELLLLSRDLHALLLLFLMPTIFILIMSLAMQNTFSNHSTVKINYLLINEDKGKTGAALAESLAENPFYQHLDQAGSLAQLRKAVGEDEAQFLLYIPPGFSEAFAGVGGGEPQSLTTDKHSSISESGAMQVLVAPGTQAPTAALFESSIMQLTGQHLMQHMGGPAGEASLPGSLIEVKPVSEAHSIIPTSVQQNVPAWLVFSMFFIAIPVSTTLLGEQSHGTLHRLMTTGVSSSLLLFSKLLTYMMINLLQVMLMFAVGIWLVPKLGGDALTLGNSPVALVLIAAATSLAAVSFALLIANLAKTTEQATILAGVSNIVLAALGGVMVPRFVMPPTMQKISLFFTSLLGA